MALETPWPSVRQAVIRQLRSNLVLEDVLLGDWSESVAPKDTPFPRGILQLHFAPAEYDTTGMVSIVGFDAVVFSKDYGEAGSLDQLVFTSLQDAALNVAGQTSLMCRRVSTLSLAEAAPDGTDTVWQAGGVYAVTTAQSNPALRHLDVTMDSTIG